jgi:hypothetical protein
LHLFLEVAPIGVNVCVHVTTKHRDALGVDDVVRCRRPGLCEHVDVITVGEPQYERILVTLKHDREAGSHRDLGAQPRHLEADRLRKSGKLLGRTGPGRAAVADSVSGAVRLGAGGQFEHRLVGPTGAVTERD